MPTRKPYDALIVGGGHNGLTCACYLAAAGYRVRVLERRTVVGGAAVTEEFFPGFRNSAAAYTVSLLHPKVIRDLRLAEHGLKIVERPIASFLPLSPKSYLKVGNALGQTQTEVGRFSTRDAERLSDYYAMLERAGNVLRGLLLETPPNVGGGARDVLAALRVGYRMRKVGMAARRDFLDLMTKSAGDVLDAWFESDAIKAAFGFDAVVGHYASPYAPGSAYVLLHHVIGEVNGRRGAWGHAVGGMGSITQAMAQEAERRGVEITTRCEVHKVCVDGRGAQGVQLKDGSMVDGRCVVANVNPRLLFLKLVDDGLLEPDFVRRIRRYKCGSATFRMNVALSELPDFTCLPGPGRHLPKDENRFDEFGNLLFRDRYRIRAEDVFDLGFLEQNEQLQQARRAAEAAIRADFRLASQQPYRLFADGRIPGEELLVDRMIYDVIKRLSNSARDPHWLDQRVPLERLILFRAPQQGGYEVVFLHSLPRTWDEAAENEVIRDYAPEAFRHRCGFGPRPLPAAGRGAIRARCSWPA